MADSLIQQPLDYEALTNLAGRLADHADGIEQVTLHPLEQDIRTARGVVDEHANWRFRIEEIAATLPFENPAKRELLTLIGKEG
jgi:hypothetical protein